jgi:predicted RNase H-like HicB family nuclease
MKAYHVEVKLSRQEDGLWRAQVPELQGCWVDAPTIAEALRDVQEVAAMFIDLLDEEGRPLPDSVKVVKSHPARATLVVIPQEHALKRPAGRTRAQTSIS